MSNKAIAPAALVLVTGVNGYIASHIADQLLALGYRVRGTARDQAKIDMIAESLCERNQSAHFEGFVLSDLTEQGAFENAMSGCEGVVHVATDVSFDYDPNKVVPQVVQACRNALQAAEDSRTVKRFVYTSSSIAAVHPIPNERYHVDSESWNDIDHRAAWAPPPYDLSRAFAVYAASKVEAEKAGWEFMKTKRRFVLNTILPYFTIGPRLNKQQHGSTSGWVNGLFNGDEVNSQRMRGFPPQYAVDVRDVARTHVAALLEPDVENERLLAFAETYNYSKIVATLKKIDPSRQNYPSPPRNEGEDLSTAVTERAIELLKRMGQPGFIGLEQSLREQLQG